MDIRGFYLQENSVYNVFDQNNGNMLSENVTYLGMSEHGRYRFRLNNGNIRIIEPNANVFYILVSSNQKIPGVEGTGKGYKRHSKRHSKRHYKRHSKRHYKKKSRRHKSRSRK